MTSSLHERWRDSASAVILYVDTHVEVNQCIYAQIMFLCVFPMYMYTCICTHACMHAGRRQAGRQAGLLACLLAYTLTCLLVYLTASVHTYVPECIYSSIRPVIHSTALLTNCSTRTGRTSDVLGCAMTTY